MCIGNAWVTEERSQMSLYSPYMYQLNLILYYVYGNQTKYNYTILYDFISVQVLIAIFVYLLIISVAKTLIEPHLVEGSIYYRFIMYWTDYMQGIIKSFDYSSRTMGGKILDLSVKIFSFLFFALYFSAINNILKDSSNPYSSLHQVIDVSDPNPSVKFVVKPTYSPMLFNYLNNEFGVSTEYYQQKLLVPNDSDADADIYNLILERTNKGLTTVWIDDKQSTVFTYIQNAHKCDDVYVFPPIIGTFDAGWGLSDQYYLTLSIEIEKLKLSGYVSSQVLYSDYDRFHDCTKSVPGLQSSGLGQTVGLFVQALIFVGIAAVIRILIWCYGNASDIQNLIVTKEEQLVAVKGHTYISDDTKIYNELMYNNRGDEVKLQIEDELNGSLKIHPSSVQLFTNEYFEVLAKLRDSGYNFNKIDYIKIGKCNVFVPKNINQLINEYMYNKQIAANM